MTVKPENQPQGGSYLSVHSIFITNNGLSDHIGVSQILPYLEGLSSSGHKVSCISVENPSKAGVYNNNVKPRLAATQVTHYPIMRSIHPKVRKLESLLMTRRLRKRLLEVATSTHVDLLHCRSYMPLGPALCLSKKMGLPLIFDMRGFWIDERIESGIWRADKFIWKPIIAYFRRLERQALESSSAIIVLTQDAKHVVTAHPDFGGCPVEVVPCSVNQQIFVPHPEQRALQRERFDFEPDDLVIAYLGSSGPLYCIDEVYKLVARLKDHGCNARLLFLGEHRIETHLQRARALGLAMVESDFRCYKVPHHEVPIVLSAADFGISFRIPTFSSLGVSATKVGEYMACGIPVITSKGIGDIERIIKDGSSGVVLSNFSDDEIERAAMLIVDNNFSPANQIRETTRSIFNIERAIVQYDRLYRDSNKSKSGVNNVRRTS